MIRGDSLRLFRSGKKGRLWSTAPGEPGDVQAMRVMRMRRVVDGYIDWHTGMRRKALSSGEESDGCLKGEIGRAERKPMDEDADLCRCAPKWGDASVQVDVDHARLDTISEKAPFQKVHSTPCLASRVSRSLKYYIYRHVMLLRLSFHNVFVTLLPVVHPPSRATADDHPASR